MHFRLQVFFGGFRMKRVLLVVSLLAAAILVPVFGSSPVGAATPGGVFVTGHDPDFHATYLPANPEGARNILRRAVTYVTSGAADPRMLLVSSRMTPPPGFLDSLAGLQAAGFSPDVASAVTGSGDAPIDLNAVNFNDYGVVVVASDYGGLLRQAELNILNARLAAILSFVNNGGGLVALAESNSSDAGPNSGLTPDGGQYLFLPFLVSNVVANQFENGYTVTPFGSAMGLTENDVNGNASHAAFSAEGGLQVVDRDAAGHIISLATRGQLICPTGVPQASISDVRKAEGNSGITPFTFTVSLDKAPCGTSVTVNYTTSFGTADGIDLTPANGSVTFGPNDTNTQVTVNVNGDTTFEQDETFFVDITAPFLGIAKGRGNGVILNDDIAGRKGAFACRASGLRLAAIEPDVANNAFTPCVDAGKTVVSAGLTSGAVNVASGTLVAATDQNPNSLTGTTPATTDYGLATATVEKATVSALGLVNVSTVDVRSQAKVSCVTGPGGLLPALTASSSIASLKINGLSVGVTGSANIALPLGLGSVQINRTVTTATTITQQAVRVQLLGLEVVIAEAKAGFTGTNPCAQ